MLQANIERVPYFQFQDREHGVNVEASKTLGYDVPLMQTFILILPHGSRGEPMEFIAEEFIARKKVEATQGRYEMEWVKAFKNGLELHRDGKELPRTGTPLATWERILKSRRETLSRVFPTVEDLAAVPDSSLGTIGLDGRVLRDMARGDVQAKLDLSPVVKELADAKEDNRRLQEQLAAVMARLELLEDDKPKRGRPRAETTE